METLRSTFGALADWATRRIAWLRATLDLDGAGRHDSERGQGLAEYALILSLIAIVAIGALAFFGEQLNAVFLDPISKDIGDVLSSL
jgi:Flp pilus assembly pilin Flp